MLQYSLAVRATGIAPVWLVVISIILVPLVVTVIPVVLVVTTIVLVPLGVTIVLVVLVFILLVLLVVTCSVLVPLVVTSLGLILRGTEGWIKCGSQQRKKQGSVPAVKSILTSRLLLMVVLSSAAAAYKLISVWLCFHVTRHTACSGASSIVEHFSIC
jgi:hypothetical protein